MATQAEVFKAIKKARFWKAAAEMKYVVIEYRLKRARTHPRKIEEALAPLVEEYNLTMGFIVAMTAAIPLLPN